MKPEEAEQLAGFLKGAFPNLSEEQIDVYQSSLIFEDAQLASKAILAGIREWKYPPRYAEIVELIRMERRKTGAVAKTAPPGLEEAMADATVPDWVKRWVYARFVIKPPDLRPFRESYPDVVERGEEPAMGWMPGNEYALQAKQITDDMVRAKVAQVTTGAMSPLLEALGPER